MIRIRWYDQKWSLIVMRYIVYVCIALGSAFCVWHYGLSDRLLLTVTVVPDPVLTYSARIAIKEFIHDHYHRGTHYDQPALFYENLTHTFGCIKDVRYVRKHRTHGYFKIQAHKPVVVLNGTQGITADGLRVGTHFYDSEKILLLPQILSDQVITPSELYQLVRWAQTVPEFVRCQVTIVWKNPTEIDLFFKEYPKNPVRITTKTDLSASSIDAIKKIIACQDVIYVDARFEGVFIAGYEPLKPVVKKNIKNRENTL